MLDNKCYISYYNIKGEKNIYIYVFLFSYSCKNLNLSFVKYFLDKYNSKININDDYDEAFRNACSNNKIDTVKFLLYYYT